MFFILERTFQVDYPLVFSLNQNLSLGLDMPYLIFVKHFRFLHLFHSNNLVSLFKFADTNLSKSTPSNDTQWIKISESDLLPPKSRISRCSSYIFLLSSASLCRISYLMSSYSASLRLSFSIFLTSISHANKL